MGETIYWKNGTLDNLSVSARAADVMEISSTSAPDIHSLSKNNVISSKVKSYNVCCCIFCLMSIFFYKICEL